MRAIEMAFDKTTICDGWFWGDRSAEFHHLAETRVEPATGRQVEGVGVGGAEVRVGQTKPRFGREHRSQQGLGVGMLGCPK